MKVFSVLINDYVGPAFLAKTTTKDLMELLGND